MTKPAFKMFFQIFLAFIFFEKVPSIKYIYEHFISKISKSSLNDFYYFLARSKFEVETFIETSILTVIKFFCKTSNEFKVYIIIDDTLIPKYGTHFACYMKHHDHCSRNGTSYLKGHNFVCLSIAFPIRKVEGEFKYITVPIGIKIYSGNKSKLKLAQELIEVAMKHLTEYNVVLLCDAWYSKSNVLNCVKKYDNLNLFASIRSDTAIYELPEKSTGRGRPRIRGNKIHIEELNFIKEDDYYVARKRVMTKLFKEAVYIYVTTKDIETYSKARMFISTSKYSFSMKKSEKTDMKTNTYYMRWSIEVIFYELKKFWSFSDYKVRNQRSIELLLNIICVVFMSCTIFRCLNEELHLKSPQESRIYLSEHLHKELILCSFGKYIESVKNYKQIQKLLKKFNLENQKISNFL
jgi:hypothetical protein